MKKLLAGLAVVVVLLIAAVVAIPFLVPAEAIADRAIAQFREATGRELRVDGEISFSVLPSAAVTLGDVWVGNREGGRSEHFATLEKLDLRVALFPMISGNVEISRLVLHQPNIALEMDENGTGNWQFGDPGTEPAAAPPETESGDQAGGEPAGDEPSGNQGSGSGIIGLRFGEVEIVDGAVTYADLATGQQITLDAVNLAIEMANLDSPLAVDGTAEVQGRPVSLSLAAERPSAMLSGDGTAIAVALESELLNLAFDGTAAGAPSPAAAGDLGFEVVSVRAVADWLGIAPPDGLPIDSIDLSGAIDASGQRFAATGLDFTTDALDGSGSLAVDVSQAKPIVSGDLQFGVIDVDRLTAPGGDTAAEAAGEAPPNPDAAATDAPTPDTAAGEAPADNQESAAEPAPIDLSVLQLAEIDLVLAWEGIVAQGVEAGGSSANIALHDGVLDVALARTPVFGGEIALDIDARSAAEIAEVAVDLMFDGIQLAPLAGQVAAIRDAAGSASGRITATGSGATPEAMMAGLQGNGSLSLAGAAATVPGRDGTPDMRIEGLNLTAEMPSFDDALTANGNLSLQGQPVTFDVTAAQPRAALSGAATDLSVALEVPQGHARFDGNVAPAQPAANGAIDVAIDDIATLLSWLQTGQGDLPVNSLVVTGQIEASPSGAGITGMSLRADDLTAQGSVAVAMDGARPAISGQLDTGPIDLDRLLAAGGGAQASDAATSAPTAPETGTGNAAQGGSGSAGGAPIDLSPLHSADLDLTVNSGGFRVSQIDVGPTTLTVALNGGVLDAAMTPAGVFGGTASGSIHADGAAAVPAIGIEAVIDGAQAEPLLTRFGGIDWLVGTTAANLAVSGSGETVDALLATLDGTASMLFSDGAIKGVNIAALLRSAGTLGLDSQAGAAQQTDFAALGGSFTIADGVATTDDLTMLAPLFRVAGAGQISLPERHVRMRLEPQLVANLEGQGGEAADGGLVVPVIVEGPFDNVGFRPDVEGAIQGLLADPQALANQVEAFQGGADPSALIGGGDPSAAIESLLGSGTPEAEAAGQLLQGLTGQGATGEPGSEEEPAAPEDAARQAIEGLLGAPPQDGEEQEDPAQRLLRGVFGN